MQQNEQPIRTVEPAPAGEAADQVPGRPRRRRGIVAVLAGTALMVVSIGVPAVLAAGPGAAPAANPGAAPAEGLAVTPAEGTISATNVDAAAADAAFKEFATCMREHGIEMPDPVVVQAQPAAGGSLPNLVPASGGITVTGGGIVGATGASVPDQDFQAANDACSPILEKAGIHAGSGTIDVTNGTVLGGPVGSGVVGIVVAGRGDIAEQAASMKAYAACIRTHGVDVADPVVDEKAGSAQLSFPVDPGSAAFRTADAACAVDGVSFAPPVAPAP